MYEDKGQLDRWKVEIDRFLSEELKLQLHPEKSKVISLSKGIDFVGFRNFWRHKLLRKRNVKNILIKIKKYKNCELSKVKMLEIFNGWNAYAKWANSYKLRKDVVKKIYAPNIL